MNFKLKLLVALVLALALMVIVGGVLSSRSGVPDRSPSAFSTRFQPVPPVVRDIGTIKELPAVPLGKSPPSKPQSADQRGRHEARSEH
jgi:hypothetical protein